MVAMVELINGAGGSSARYGDGGEIMVAVVVLLEDGQASAGNGGME